MNPLSKDIYDIKDIFQLKVPIETRTPHYTGQNVRSKTCSLKREVQLFFILLNYVILYDLKTTELVNSIQAHFKVSPR